VTENAVAARIEFLRALPLFADHRADELEAVALLVTEADVPPGYVLMREREVGREAYMLVDGRAAVKVAGKRLALLGPGSILGGESLLDGLRVATIVAETPLRLYVIERRSFLRALLRTTQRGHPAAKLDIPPEVGRTGMEDDWG